MGNLKEINEILVSNWEFLFPFEPWIVGGYELIYSLVEFKPHLAEECDLCTSVSYNRVGKNSKGWKWDSFFLKH